MLSFWSGCQMCGLPSFTTQQTWKSFTTYQTWKSFTTYQTWKSFTTQQTWKSFTSYRTWTNFTTYYTWKSFTSGQTWKSFKSVLEFSSSNSLDFWIRSCIEKSTLILFSLIFLSLPLSARRAHDVIGVDRGRSWDNPLLRRTLSPQKCHKFVGFWKFLLGPGFFLCFLNFLGGLIANITL